MASATNDGASPDQLLSAASDANGHLVDEQAVDLEGIGALDLTPSKCRFPLWHSNARVSHRYCGKRIESATAVYCPEHRQICFNVGAGTRKLNAKRGAAMTERLEKLA